MKYITLNENIRYVKKVLGTPYHFFTLSNTNKNLIILIAENKDGSRHFRFTGSSIKNAVEEAYNYVIAEINAGQLKDIEEKKQKENDKEENKQDNIKNSKKNEKK